MPKKDKRIDDGLETVEEQESEVFEPVVEELKRYYEKVSWRGVKDVFRCTECGTNRDDFDAMVEHILLHHKGHEEEMLEILIKEK